MAGAGVANGHQRMHRCRVLSYSVGHFMNDMCAACWCVALSVVSRQAARSLVATAPQVFVFACISSKRCWVRVVHDGSQHSQHILTPCWRLCRLGASDAGIVMFSGQAADAVGTLVVGLLCDKTTGFPSIGLGRRKSWNFAGVITVACKCIPAPARL